MALIKDIITRSGVVVSYWKISDWRINQSVKSMDITLTPYISNEARKEGYEPLRDEIRKIRAVDFSSKNFIQNDYSNWFSPEALEKAASQGKTIYNVMYDYIKYKDPEFKDAGDMFN